MIKIVKTDNLLEIIGDDYGTLKAICNSLLVFYRKKFNVDNTGKSQFTLEKMPLYYFYSDKSVFTYAGNLFKLEQFMKMHKIEYSLEVKDTKNLMNLETDPTVFTKYSLRYGQKECLEAISKHERGIIEAPTGWGKSHLFGVICDYFPKSKVDIVVPRIDSLLMIYKRLKNNFGEENVGLLYGEKVELNKRITVISINSLDKTPFDKVNIVLADEIQNYATDKRLTLFSKYVTSRMYGFSADAKARLDNAFPALESLFGPIIFKLSYAQALQKSLVVPIIIKWIPVYSGSSQIIATTEQFVRRKRIGLWNNTERNKKIAEIALSLPDDEQVLIIVETVEHLARLIELLPDFIPCYASMDYKRLKRRVRKDILERMEFLIKSVGGRKKLEEDFKNGAIKKAIATKVWSESVDFPNLSILIRADGSASPNLDVQIPGRVSRISTGKQYGVIYDFIDLFDKSFFKRSYTRYLNYKKMGWIQENTEAFKENYL